MESCIDIIEIKYKNHRSFLLLYIVTKHLTWIFLFANIVCEIKAAMLVDLPHTAKKKVLSLCYKISLCITVYNITNFQLINLEVINCAYKLCYQILLNKILHQIFFESFSTSSDFEYEIRWGYWPKCSR